MKCTRISSVTKADARLLSEVQEHLLIAFNKVFQLFSYIGVQKIFMSYI